MMRFTHRSMRCIDLRKAQALLVDPTRATPTAPLEDAAGTSDQELRYLELSQMLATALSREKELLERRESQNKRRCLIWQMNDRHEVPLYQRDQRVIQETNETSETNKRARLAPSLERRHIYHSFMPEADQKTLAASRRSSELHGANWAACYAYMKAGGRKCLLCGDDPQAKPPAPSTPTISAERKRRSDSCTAIALDHGCPSPTGVVTVSWCYACFDCYRESVEETTYPAENTTTTCAFCGRSLLPVPGCQCQETHLRERALVGPHIMHIMRIRHIYAIYIYIYIFFFIQPSLRWAPTSRAWNIATTSKGPFAI